MNANLSNDSDSVEVDQGSETIDTDLVKIRTPIPSTFHGWSSPRFPDELKLLCLEHYWHLNAELFVDEKIHTRLVEEHLIPMVQALGKMAQETYYKTVYFHIRLGQNHRFKYPRFGQWVQLLLVHVDVYVPVRTGPKSLSRDVPEGWFFYSETGLRWLLSYKKSLDFTKLAPFAQQMFKGICLGSSHIGSDTHWQTKFPNLSGLLLYVALKKFKCFEIAWQGMLTDCTVGCSGNTNVSVLGSIIQDSEIVLRAKKVHVEVLDNCNVDNPESKSKGGLSIQQGLLALLEKKTLSEASGGI
ncbi:hypothetical protein K491DRAFT_745423 [Lophiostoma macrostomum CBS 122681]|uniref:Uncharacterized protein n=1 Tax=Lophiostoma macrostomum CBS 122681 TaxID=1314788 RepID=A0A6A6T963_9PLEO|nr:hypothetical protein K491DRAFT_745423 [Lophiostoma macrostomum CBS 122681]